MKKIITILIVVLSVLYPVLVFVFLYFLKTPVRVLSIFIIIVAAGIFLSFTSRNKGTKKNLIDIRQIITPILLLTAGLLCLLTNKIFFLKLYSVFLCAIFLFLFGSTLFFEPTMIFRFATLADKSIIGSSYEEKVKNYCRNITIIWCLFFILNGTLSTLTAFSQNIFKITEEQADKIWTIYNGAISYILMGLLFAVEYLVRIIYDRHLIKTEPLSKLRLFSRKESHILCISKTDKTKKTWCDFLSETECLRNKYASTSDKQIILGKLNEWDFLINLCAVIQSKNIPVIDFSNSSTPEIDLTGIKKHSNDIPQIQSETAKIIIHQDENIKQTTLFEIEETINSIIKTNGNKLVLQKNPSTLIQNDAEKFLENLLLHFTLGLKFYSHRSDR